MYIRAIDNLNRSLQADSAILGRENITKWLMQFSARAPVRFYHPLIGDIAYSGVRFAGSVIPTFDRYVCLMIEDLIEKHVSLAEVELAEVDPEQVQDVAFKATALIVSARQKLLARGAAIKGRLLGDPNKASEPVPLGASGVLQVQVAQRMNARVDEIRKKLPPKVPGPLWGWLEGFAKQNPALSNLMSFLIGAALTLLGMFLK